MNLQSIKDRCRIDDETGCWIWTAGVSRGRAGSMLPCCHFDGRIHSVPRLVLALSGKPLTKGQKAFRSCLNQLCVCPDHVKGGSHKAVGRMLAATGGARGVHRSIVAVKAARKRSKITAEIANEIRNSSEVARIVAERYGVSRSLVYHIRNGTTWRPPHGLFSFIGSRP